ncbi:MAG TPA: hypothetical protein VFP90_11915 [Gemmatimonadaceae bacterium]|nr:hypothetical protein [Gemmatimonadaceae bacterium]
MTAIVVRPLMPEDARSAHDLLERAFRGTAYLLRLREVLDDALRFEDPEYLCLLAESERESALEGLVLFGTILGARLATRVHAVVAPDPRVQLALLDAVRETCVRSRERLVICELPHDTPFDLAWIALVARGYREEGRIEDFVRDGVALRLLVWRPNGEAARA